MNHIKENDNIEISIQYVVWKDARWTTNVKLGGVVIESGEYLTRDTAITNAINALINSGVRAFLLD